MIETMKKILLLTVAVLTLAACAPTRNTNGMYLDEIEVTKLQAGTSTRADVLQTLGTPSTTAVFDENTWYYVGQKTEKKAFFDAKVTDKKVYEVKFNEDGVLASVQQVEGDAINVPIVRRKTPTSGHDLTAAQQLLGNLGRFNKKQTDKVPGSI